MGRESGLGGEVVVEEDAGWGRAVWKKAGLVSKWAQDYCRMLASTTRNVK